MGGVLRNPEEERLIAVWGGDTAHDLEGRSDETRALDTPCMPRVGKISPTLHLRRPQRVQTPLLREEGEGIAPASLATTFQ